MSWNQLTKDWLRFSKKDRVGAMVVIGLMLFIYLLPKLSAKNNETLAIVPNNILKNAIDTLQSKSNEERENLYAEEESANNYHYEPSQSKGFTAGALFQFDPNTISALEWRRLGLNERTIKTINNYTNKGGKFYKPEDLKKIWGMPDGFYERVEEYISIASSPRKENTYTPQYAGANLYEKKERKINTININEGDTTAFIALPGIGSKLAFRIVNFRNKLGGFYSVNQVSEAYGLPDSTFQKIKPFLKEDASGIKKININTATKDELKIHPYIKWNLANAIVEYRIQHGEYKSLEDLKNIDLVEEVTFKKIAPYFTLQ